MSRFKSLLLALTVAGAVVTFLRNRWSGDAPLDQGGWEPVDPAR